MKPTAEQVAAFAGADLDGVFLGDLMQRISPPAPPPSPYDIALHLAGALLASGRFADDQTAAVEVAWTLVIPFYQGRATYERLGHNLAAVAGYAASAAEGDMSAAEARAYVTGGETGHTGEAGGGADLATMPAADLAAIAARQTLIAETTRAVQGAESRLFEAREQLAELDDDAPECERERLKALIGRYQAEFDQAARAQSAAYE